MMVRSEAFREVGGFDPRFFLYFEETDLCRRLRTAGWELWAVGSASATHLEGASARKVEPGLAPGECLSDHYFRSRYYFLSKHYGLLAAAASEAAEILILAARDLLKAILARPARHELRSRLKRSIFQPPSRPADAKGTPPVRHLGWPAHPAGAAREGERSAAAVVVIGRNEGERLRSALAPVAGGPVPVLYVDSGSADGSPMLARTLGVEVLELDPSRPWSAARARNEGVERLLRRFPSLEFVQFLDGDCSLAAGWLDRGVAELIARPDAGVVCGRLRELKPEASVYNRLCQREWDRPAGEVSECGGIMMARIRAFREAGGFDARLIAGEDPELCLRLRRAGWTIHRIDAEMAVHDAAMVRFSQWWTRAVRAGHAYAQAASLHGGSPERYRVREVRSILAWSAGLPLVVALLAWPTSGWSLLAVLLYPLQVLRIAGRERRRRTGWRDAVLQGLFCVLAKWPQLQGWIRFQRRRRAPGGPVIIEHKSSPMRDTL
jgi:GT2 family glycosyltransferase